MKINELKSYKDNLYAALSRDLSDFEKNFLLISSGILAFSITFIKDIVNIRTASQLFLLFLSWALFILATGLMMFTFLNSARSSDKLWYAVDDFLIEKKLFKQEDELSPSDAEEIKIKTNTIFKDEKNNLSQMRKFAIYVFIAGLLFLAISSEVICGKKIAGEILMKQFYLKKARTTKLSL